MLRAFCVWGVFWMRLCVWAAAIIVESLFDVRFADEACVIGLTKLMGQVLDIVAVDFCNFWRTRWITMLD